jgi:hypothetical protein
MTPAQVAGIEAMCRFFAGPTVPRDTGDLAADWDDLDENGTDGSPVNEPTAE